MEKFLHPVELKNVSYERNKIRFQKKFKSFTFFTATLMLMFFSSILTNAQTVSNANATETTSVLKLCLELPELQQFYPKQSNGKAYALKIMQHGVSFPSSVVVSHDGISVLYLSKSQINENNENAYFYFNEFFVEANKARADFTFYYDVQSAEKMQVISLEFQKNSSGWFISNKKIESR